MPIEQVEAELEKRGLMPGVQRNIALVKRLLERENNRFDFESPIAEKVLRLQLNLNEAVNNIVGVFPPQGDLKERLIATVNAYINGVADYIAALRSRAPQYEPKGDPK